MSARIRIRDATNTLRTVSRIRMRDAGGVLRTIQRIRVRDALGTLRTVWQYLQAGVNKVTTEGSYNGASSSAQDITTAAVVASPIGGTGPFTYLWSQVGVSAYTWTIGTATAADTTFTGVAIPAGTVESVTFQCVITDSTGATATTVEVTAIVYNNSTA